MSISKQLPLIALSKSVQGKLIEAVVTVGKALQLEGLADDRWFIRKQLWDVHLKDLTPCVIVAPAAKGIDWNAGAAEEDEISYGVAAAFITAGNLILTPETMGVQLVWTETFTSRFLNHRDYFGTDGTQVLPGKWVNRTNVVPPSETFMEQAMRMRWDAQYMILRFVVSETRENA